MKAIHSTLCTFLLLLVVAGNSMADEEVIRPAPGSAVLKLSRYDSGENRLQLYPRHDFEQLSLASEDFLLNNAPRTRIRIDLNPAELLTLKKEELKKILKELDIPLFSWKNTNVRLKVRGSKYMAMVNYKF